MTPRLALPAALAAFALAAPAPAPAETFHTCAGFIDSLPAVLTSQGVWCLRKDLSTAINGGSAIIDVKASNVTIDCNRFKIGGLAGGPGSAAIAIHAADRRNITVRNCTIRGFGIGIHLADAGLPEGGHVVEDNIVESSYWLGIHVGGMDNVVRRNHVRDTGGSVSDAYSAAIEAEGTADILDNTITGVAPALPFWDETLGDAFGILTQSNDAGAITGNRIRDLGRSESGQTTAIRNLASGRVLVAGNHLSNPDVYDVNGIECANALGRARDNTILGFGNGITGCSVDTGNVLGQ